jgi:hypothetical protein
VAHAHNLGDGFHRQAVFVGSTDCFIALVSQLVASAGQLGLALGELPGEGSKAVPGFGGLAFGSGDSMIVRPILANRLA